MAGSHLNVGALHHATGKLTEAFAAYSQALEVWQRIVHEYPTDTQIRRGLAASLNNIGLIQIAMGRSEEALASSTKAHEIFERLLQEAPDLIQAQTDLADSYGNIGALQGETGLTSEAMASLTRMFEIRDRLVKENPAVTKFQSDLAISHMTIGNRHTVNGKPSEALAALTHAKEIQDRLVRENPTVTQFQSSLADTYVRIGYLFLLTGKPEEARAVYIQARDIQEKLVRGNPDVISFASDLGETLSNIAYFDLDAERFTQAHEILLQAIHLQRKPLASNASNQKYRGRLANHFKNLIRACRGLGDAEGVADAQRQLAELIASDPRFKVFDLRLAEIAEGKTAKDNPERLALAQRAYDTKRFTMATKLFAESLAIDSKLAENRKTQVRYNAACCAALALAGTSTGKDAILDDEGKIQLFRQAFGWLSGELQAWSTLLESGTPQAKTIVANTLAHWKRDPDLAGMRDSVALAKLPESERADCERLWKRVEELLSKATSKD